MALMSDFDSPLPVAVIGAGPVGLATAAHLLAEGESPVVFEAGAGVGTNVLDWGHVRLFSPWRYVIDAAARDLLQDSGWLEPDLDAYPTGEEIVTRYLAPLAAVPELRPRIRLGSRVVGVARDGFDKMKTEGREHAPFILTVESAHGQEQVLVKAVIDASGTTATPNPLGAAGIPAIGERAVAGRIFYGIPDVLGRHRDDYASRRVLVVGSGHSAFNALIDLVDLAAAAPGTSVTWAIRRPAGHLRNLFGGGIADALPARGELGERVRGLVDAGNLRLVTGFKVARLTETEDGVLVAGDDEVLGPFDRIVAATGFRPDLSLLSEVRLDLDPAVESPRALAPLIDPNVHSCGSVPPHGEAELRQPESGLYIAGMKSYGRAPTFLMLTGYEQVRSVAAAIAGDWGAARDVRLVLPETGVCSSGILAVRGVACCPSAAALDETSDAACCPLTASGLSTAGSCCGTEEPQVVQLSGALGGGCCR
ncbi:MAG TPA: NAD(P)-binding domain-containing protein [Thermomicrobiales bacterium]|nr:NAD(P)-binding domain-containing protein [Thermomicrobiales bacterium]